MVQSNLQTVDEADPGYGQLFAILIRRRFWVVGVLGIVLAIATFKAFTTKPTYQSSLQLLVEPNYQGKEQQGQEGASSIVDTQVEVDSATQLSVMRSSQLIKKAVDLLRPQYPDLTVKAIKESLSVNQVEGDGDNKTKIFEATYIDNDPIKTQKSSKSHTAGLSGLQP